MKPPARPSHEAGPSHEEISLVRILIAAALFLCSPMARAAELLMFHQRGCVHCQRWENEIGVGYSATTEARRAPLRRLDLRDKLPDGITLKRNVTITPTFVLVDDGKEIGRVVGYPGADFFYGMLDEVMAKLPAEPVAPSSAGSVSEPEQRSSSR